MLRFEGMGSEEIVVGQFIECLKIISISSLTSDMS